jgi:hypothetical protein
MTALDEHPVRASLFDWLGAVGAAVAAGAKAAQDHLEERERTRKATLSGAQADLAGEQGKPGG